MKAVRHIVQNSLSEPIDTKQKSRITNSLNTFLCFYPIKGIIDCFYYTFSLAFLLSSLPYSFIFNSVFGFLLSYLTFSLYLPFPCYYSSVQAPAVSTQLLHVPL